jgi:hypothetical protein
MRGKLLQLLFLSIGILFTGTSLNAQSTVTFQVDMNGTNLTKGAFIGIRGSMPPLSWSNSIEMTDPDKDGIFTVSVPFINGRPGDRVLYKYTANDQWDNDVFGPFGNRSVTLCTIPVIQPVDKWNTVTEFSFESLLEHAYYTEMDLLVYLVGKAKLEGKNPESVMQDMMKFWGDDFSWIQSPQVVMMMNMLRQAKYMDGYFEQMIDEPDRVQFMIYKPGTYYFGNRTDNGTFKGVTQDDLIKMDKYYLETLAKAKGWKLKWEEKGKLVIITLTR